MRHLFLAAVISLSPLAAHSSDWAPITTSGDGQILWSTRNFQVVSERDKFTVEIRTQYLPGTSQAAQADVVMELSCKKQTAQVKSDTVTLADGTILTNAIVDKVPFSPEQGSFPKFLLYTTCPHKEKVRPKVVI